MVVNCTFIFKNKSEKMLSKEKRCYIIHIMDEKLDKLFNECISELKSIGIDVKNNNVGEVNICLAKRNTKRYGCCKQKNPQSYHYEKRGKYKVKVYDKFEKNNIEISKWVMELDEKVIKNTIMHEIIHCFYGCNNHGVKFKKYAEYINDNLGYSISRVGNKEEDFKKSNIEYIPEKQNYKYKIICPGCGQIFYRQRLKKNFFKIFRCGKCKGKLYLEK